MKYWGKVSENTVVGSVVLIANSSTVEPLVMFAKDNDSRVNALLQFEIVEPFARSSFYIDAFTGDHIFYVIFFILLDVKKKSWIFNTILS